MDEDECIYFIQDLHKLHITFTMKFMQLSSEMLAT